MKYELSCKYYALADLMNGLEAATGIGLHENTAYGLTLLMGGHCR
jgi:hypothetical protein